MPITDQTSTPEKSGVNMDRQIAHRRQPLKVALWSLAIITLVSVLALLWWDRSNNRSFTINNDRVVIAPVTKGLFDDFIPIRGRVTPRKTVFLDLIEGGQVERRLVDDGALVRQGELLVVLNNTSLQLDVTRNEAIVTEQLNNMRTIELQLEQNRLRHKSTLVELNYQIQRLGRLIERLTNLDNDGFASRSELEDARDELSYNENRRRVTLESQETDARLQETQLEFLQATNSQLQENLKLARKTLEALNVRAPVAGKLSGLDAEVGQSIQRGGRLGQIDDPANFKLRVNIDEYYLNRVDIGQRARLERNGQSYDLSVRKIYPQVNNGQFELDLGFINQQPSDIRRGQTLQATLTLGESAPATLIPNGAFFADTGGNWIFVLNAQQTSAIKRPVRLGRRNAQHIEVLDGLEVGESIIASPYSSFSKMERLTLIAN